MTRLLIIIFFLFSCGGKKSPSPEPEEFILDDFPIEEAEPFYPVEESIEDIQKQIDNLRARVIEYESKIAVPNFNEQIKELIRKPEASHKIILENGTVIEGSIEQDKLDYLIVRTELGNLTINRKDIVKVEMITPNIPNLIFLGDAKEEIFSNKRTFKGKVINKGKRRGDFVRVIYYLWGNETQLIASDSSFVNGIQVRYRSGIVTDSAVDTSQSASFEVIVPVLENTPVEYITRKIHWEAYD